MFRKPTPSKRNVTYKFSKNRNVHFIIKKKTRRIFANFNINLGCQ